MKKFVLLIALLLPMTASAQSVHQIVLNIVQARGPYKPYSPFVTPTGADRIAYGYKLARLGAFVAVSFSKENKSDWYFSVENPKITIRELIGTAEFPFVKGAPMRKSYNVISGKLAGACVTAIKESINSDRISMINIESKAWRDDWANSSMCD
jgi:hypothetical protein